MKGEYRKLDYLEDEMIKGYLLSLLKCCGFQK